MIYERNILMNSIKEFLKLESASGIILLVMTVVAMLWVNSPLAFLHQRFVDFSIFSINEVLMTFFFLLVGLELKRSYYQHGTFQIKATFLPFSAALGGMLVPGLIYAAFNYHDPITLHGWATPVATDIAFVVGVLALFGRLVPPSLKLFLLSLAIFDDLGAIVIIALFYSHQLYYLYLLQSLVLLFILFSLERLQIIKRARHKRSSSFPFVLYLILGVGLWLALYHAGIHPAITGFLLALTIPMHENKKISPLHQLEKSLHPLVAFFIMPIFALANAGFSFSSLHFSVGLLSSKLVLGIVLGLFLGKQIGVFAFTWFYIRCRNLALPRKTTWLMLYGAALLCGIGFTMSLFLGTLSFQNEDILYLAEVRFSVIIGSILSGLVGAFVLHKAFIPNQKEVEKEQYR